MDGRRAAVRVAALVGLTSLCLAGAADAECWVRLPGTARDIGVGADGDTWIIGTEGRRGGYAIRRWDERRGEWRDVSGAGVRIDVGPSGSPWVVNDRGGIYRFTGGSWREMPGLARDVGIGANGDVWVIGTRRADGGYEVYRWDGSEWSRVPGGALWVSVAPDGQPWVVNDRGAILRGLELPTGRRR